MWNMVADADSIHSSFGWFLSNFVGCLMWCLRQNVYDDYDVYGVYDVYDVYDMYAV